jgi:NO-binding membrane sensor protein with MHYT domain/nitrogen-specific signal transduction histidine kinase
MANTAFITESYNSAFIALSIIVAVIASAASLDVADRIGSSAGLLRVGWISGAGIAMGGGIWAMHFIGMLALSLRVPVAYDVPTTLASLALAIAVTAAAFLIVSKRDHRIWRLAIGGMVMGLGVAGMHYVGMAAIRVPALMTYQPGLVVASVVIAVVAATAALWFAGRTTSISGRLFAAVVMGLAVSSMHYTGMAATCFTASSDAVIGRDSFDRDTLALIITVGVLVILSLELLSASVDRHFAALRLRETEVSRHARDMAEAALAELKATQESLVQAEKMASLSQLTAGVAHEINTPIGTALTAATVLQRRTDEFVRSIETGAMTKTAALKYASVAAESTALVASNIQRAATLIQSFKQVAVDQTSGEQRSFGLSSYLHEVLHSLTPRLKQTAHTVTIDCDASLVVTSYPGALAQIVTNLLVNSLVHAYPDGRTGHIAIAAHTIDGETVELRYRDDGDGIPAADVKRIFDPFFTTRRGEGGTGLGLHIVYNLATQTLHGTIDVDSDATGTRFVISFPVRAKKHADLVEVG